MDLSVIVVTYNSAPSIEACLAAARDQLPNAEFLVVDNGSTDETQRRVDRGAVKLILNGRNEGFGRACNRGAEEATRGHLLFINPDVVVVGADRQGLEQLFQLETFGLFGPAKAGGDGTIGVQHEPRLVEDWLAQTFGTLRPRGWRRRRDRHRSPRRNRWLSGSMLLARRDEFFSVGGFDPRFFLYYEDRDLSVRYQAAGLPLRATPAVAGTHTGTASSASDDLRVVPAGWAFLGWIQYLFLHRGETTARAAARSALVALNLIRATLGSVPGTAALPRVDRKRRQLEGLLRFLAAPSGADDAFCPDARRVVAAAR